MAEAFAAIGLASSIIAFVDFAQKFVSKLNKFSNDLQDGGDALGTIPTHLPVIINGLNKIRARTESGKVDDGTKAALMPIVQACHEQVKLLSDLLDRSLPGSDGSKWGRSKRAFMSLTTDAKIKKASEVLAKHLQVLMFSFSVGDTRPLSVVVVKAFWFVPFDRNLNFVGRDSIIAQIDETLKVTEVKAQPKAALHGVGGIGKSQIALEYCFKRRDRQPTCSVFWVNASTTSCFEESFQRLASEFGLIFEDGAPNDSLAMVKTWLETELLEPWVMVIDNVDDEMAFFLAKCHNLKTPSQLLPRCPHGQLIFTSRSRNVALDLGSPVSPILVNCMAIGEGLALLRMGLGPQPLNAHLVELLSRLGHIPLAITQAISFILTARMSVEQYLELYSMEETSSSRLLSNQFLDRGRQEPATGSVARTWEISFGWIHQIQRYSVHILCVMVFYQHQDVQARLLQDEDYDPLDFKDSITALIDLSLLEWRSQDNTYSTHRLVQVATRLWLENQGPATMENWALIALHRLAGWFPHMGTYQSMNDYREHCQALIPHADLLLGHSFNTFKTSSEVKKARLLYLTAQYLETTGLDVDEITRCHEKSLDLRQRHLGPNHPATWSSMNRYFRFLSFPGVLYPPGMDGHRMAEMGHALMRHHRQVLGPRHHKTIKFMIYMGRFLQKERKFGQAEALLRDALWLSRVLRGQNESRTLECLNCLVFALGAMKRLDWVLEILRESTGIGTEISGPEHSDILEWKSITALWLEDSGRIDEAIPLSREVLALREKVLGPDHPETLSSARQLAASLSVGRRYHEALDILDYVLKIVQARQRVYRRPLSAQGIMELRSEIEEKMGLDSRIG
ncbi:hypothetical protein DHEL01_v211191 [Diaporthe helianthi]|uniref:NACHT-NTPase and P-loop NTPases N-terminal domain-containing protein n=1 Tax=Diaporthe helianthi TaxID=158607 RepID=A0A2P5HJH9_DIAHE|nr:hypothetical protein DHEL01_v211191 [Diaporthe helianthi]